MTDFTPGPIITRDNPLCDVWPPSWLREDALIRPAGCRFAAARISYWNWQNVQGFSLDASDIVYRCIEWNEAHPDEPVMWPWYGGDEAPADWSGGLVLLNNGDACQNTFWDWSFGGPDACGRIVGYQRRPTTSLPEPAEDEVSRVYRDAMFSHVRGPEKADGNEFVPAYSAVETAKHYAELAGGLFVPFMSQAQADAWAEQNASAGYRAHAVGALFALGIIRTPLDIAKAEFPEIPAEKIERIAAIVKGEA